MRMFVSSSPRWRKATMTVLGRREQLELGAALDRLAGVLRQREHLIDHLGEPVAAGRAQRDQDLQRVEAP